MCFADDYDVIEASNIESASACDVVTEPSASLSCDDATAGKGSDVPNTKNCRLNETTRESDLVTESTTEPLVGISATDRDEIAKEVHDRIPSNTDAVNATSPTASVNHTTTTSSPKSIGKGKS